MQRGVFAARLGASLSFDLVTFERSFDGWSLPTSDLRWGPWLGAETHFDGVLAEGGVELSHGRIHYYEAWHTTLRLGGGYAVDTDGASSILSATLTGGLRSIPGRRHDRGDANCDRRPLVSRPSALARDLRGFVTVRSSWTEDRHVTLVAGLELSPSLFVPPYSCSGFRGKTP